MTKNENKLQKKINREKIYKFLADRVQNFELGQVFR